TVLRRHDAEQEWEPCRPRDGAIPGWLAQGPTCSNTDVADASAADAQASDGRASDADAIVPHQQQGPAPDEADLVAQPPAIAEVERAADEHVPRIGRLLVEPIVHDGRVEAAPQPRHEVVDE